MVAIITCSYDPESRAELFLNVEDFRPKLGMLPHDEDGIDPDNDKALQYDSGDTDKLVGVGLSGHISGQVKIEEKTRLLLP